MAEFSPLFLLGIGKHAIIMAAGMLCIHGIGADIHAAVLEGNVEQMTRLLKGKNRILINAQFGTDTLLTFAAKLGNYSMVVALLDMGAEVNPAFYGTTPLRAAILGGHSIVALALLARGAHANDIDEFYTTNLMLAVGQGDQALVSALLDGGATVDEVDVFDNTAFSIAVKNRHEHIATQLLYHTRGGGSEWTPLMRAAQAGRVELVNSLLASTERENVDVIVESTVSGGWTALMLSAYYGRLGSVRALLDTGRADINKANGKEGSALLFAIVQDHGEVIRLLVRRKVFLNSTYDDDPMITIAGTSCSDSTLAFLIKSGMDIDLKRDDGATLLMSLAGRDDRFKAVSAILERKVNVNQMTTKRETALLFAAAHGRKDVVEALVAAGACLDVETDTGGTALIAAAYYNRTDIVSFLLRASVDAAAAEGRESAMFDRERTAALKVAKHMHSTEAEALIARFMELEAEKRTREAAVVVAASGEQPTSSLLQERAD
jgi:ankyrin repeat protein